MHAAGAEVTRDHLPPAGAISNSRRIQQLEDEIARLKGLKTRPRIAPSTLETPPRPPRDPDAKRPGSAKRSKTAELIITTEKVVIPSSTNRTGQS